MTTPDQEREALAWLEQAHAQTDRGWAITANKPSAQITGTLLAMLAQPRLPEELTVEQIGIIAVAVHKEAGLDALGAPTPEQVRLYSAGHRALYAYLTKPKTKTVQGWRVEFAVNTETGWAPAISGYLGEESAQERAHAMSKDPRYACIKVTGPHQQEVPA